MSTENRIFMVFSAFYLIMIRYRIGLRCIILLDCYIMNKESSLRACLKKAFCKMCVTICGIFCPDEGAVAGYGNRIRAKYTAKWGVQIAGMIFQTRSKTIMKFCINIITIFPILIQYFIEAIFHIRKELNS